MAFARIVPCRREITKVRPARGFLFYICSDGPINRLRYEPDIPKGQRANDGRNTYFDVAAFLADIEPDYERYLDPIEKKQRMAAERSTHSAVIASLKD